MKQIGIISIYILILVTSSLPVLSQEPLDFIRKNYLFELAVRNKLQIKGKGKLNELISMYHFLPKSDYRQDLVSIDYFSKPLADTVISPEGKFIWHNLHSEYGLGYKSYIKTKFHQYPVKHSEYPKEHITDSLKKYLSFNNLISNNEKIKTQTESIIQGENEQFTVAFKIGNWINNNINYIKTGIEKVEPATSTLSLKYGDCDEISILYLAMLRSVGIPSRYVSGAAFGSSNFSFHAWVEIYFENVGWVPFDATFSQYGYLDQSHIKLAHGVSNPIILSNYINFYPHFGDINVDSAFPEMTVNISDSIPHNTHPFNLNIVSYKEVVGEYSYFPIIVKTKNTTPYFVSNKIHIHSIDNIEIIGNKEDCLSYAPYEEKQLKYMLRLGKVENPDVKYNTTFKVSDQFGSQEEISVSFVRFGKRITKDKAQQVLDNLDK